MTITFSVLNNDLYDLRLPQTPQYGGLPIPKKDLISLDIIPGENQIVLQVQTDKKPQTYTVSAQTNISPMQNKISRQTIFNQIININYDEYLKSEDIYTYLEKFRPIKVKLTHITKENLTQISKDVNRTLLKLDADFSATDFFEIKDITTFVSDSKYQQLNGNIYHHLLNLDQLLLQYLLLDCLYVVTILLNNDYQQGYNDIVGFLVSMMLQLKQDVFKVQYASKLKEQSEKKLYKYLSNSQHLSMKYLQFVVVVSRYAFNMIDQMSEILKFHEKYSKFNDKQLQTFNIKMGYVMFQTNKQIYQSLCLQEQYLSNIDVFQNFTPINYFQRVLLNCFTREFPLNTSLMIQNLLIQEKKENRIDMALKVCFVLASVKEERWVQDEIEMCFSQAFKGFELLSQRDFTNCWDKCNFK